MLLSNLDTVHPSYNPVRWAENAALCEGGERFTRMVGRFLLPNPAETPELFDLRKRNAAFFSYLGSIASTFASWLFLGSLSAGAFERDTDRQIADLDPVYGRLHEDVGGEVSLPAFAKARFIDALSTGVAHMLIERPSNQGEPPRTLAEYEARDLGRVTLTPLDRCELIDFERDQHGVYRWALTHTTTADRATLADSRTMIRETWRQYDATHVTVWNLTYDANEGRPPATTEIQATEDAPHGFLRVPIVDMVIPTSAIIGEVGRDAQISVFRLGAALDWSLNRCAYPMPVFKSDDEDDADQTLGAGYFIKLPTGSSFEWASPPSESFEVLRRSRDAARQELYRLCGLIQASFGDNAEQVGRSAESKRADEATSRVLLGMYAGCVSHAIEEVLEIVSESRGEADIEWHVTMASGFDATTVGSLIANAKAVRELGIASPTMLRELDGKVAAALLPDADQRTKDAIRAEIAATKT